MASKTTSLFAGRARRFLQLLADKPFVAIVVKGHTAEVYFRGMSKEEAQEVIFQSVAEVLTDQTEGDTSSG